MAQSLPFTAPRAETSHYRIAIAGNPNSGKTTLFNVLTGSRYKVANYPGVTVEKREGSFQLVDGSSHTLLDLPGTYSLNGTSLDETIATQALLGGLAKEKIPDLIIAVIDASNLERNLYLVTQLIDSGIPVVLALNMFDIAESRGIRIYTELLGRALDIPVVPLVARDGKGIEQLKVELLKQISNSHLSSRAFAWLESHSPILSELQKLGAIGQGVELSASIATLRGLGLLSEATTPDNHTTAIALHETRNSLREAGLDALSFEATLRYRFISSIIRQCIDITSPTRKLFSERVDTVATHPVFGTLIFLTIMTLIFQGIFLWAQAPMDFIDVLIGQFGQYLGGLLPAGPVKSLVVDGIIAGVGSVVIFIPQIAILFFFLGILEDSGYLARAAFLMDRFMRQVGLQGRSFIPLLSSFACAIPGIMSTRSIPSWADRVTTIMVAPLMSCSARIPVYTVLIAAVIPSTTVWGIFNLQGLTLLAMYLLGVIGAALIATLLKRTLLRREPAVFVMEMPNFRLPSLRVVLRDVFDRILLFLKNAGTIILACSIVLWFLASYPREAVDNGAPSVQHSYAGKLGTFIEPVIKPLGFNWEIGVGIIASFAAREVFVSSLATVYNLEDDDDSSSTLVASLRSKREAGTFSPLVAVSLMVFYVFACQCMSTLAVCKRETGSWRWTAFMFFYMTVLAFGASFATYQIGSMLHLGI